MNYQGLVSRNSGVISRTLQSKIKKTKILFAGCGLGSVIAESCVRLGFTDFVLIDGDKVEFSNLNRQKYFIDQIGCHKAAALSKNLRKINRNIQIRTINEYICRENIKRIFDIVKMVDFVVNTLDFDEFFFKMNDSATKFNKTVFFPLNVGYAGFLMMFNNKSKSLDQMLNCDIPPKNEVDFYISLYKNVKGITFDNSLGRVITDLIRHRKLMGYDSQIQVGANQSSSLVVSSMINVISRRRVKYCPYAYLNTPYI